jgi:very-short-patch-repair endonuclease
MRKRPTLAEEKMRQSFLRYRPVGYKFTRQKPIGPFILDFYCANLSLAIEVDGEIHKTKQEYDHKRTLYLNEL